MAYRVEVTKRAERHLRQIYRRIQAENSRQAAAWFVGLEEAVFSLEDMPERCPAAPENGKLRHLLYGNKPHIYRVIFEIDEPHAVVWVLFIRHGARKPLPQRRGTGQ